MTLVRPVITEKCISVCKRSDKCRKSAVERCYSSAGIVEFDSTYVC